VWCRCVVSLCGVALRDVNIPIQMQGLGDPRPVLYARGAGRAVVLRIEPCGLAPAGFHPYPASPSEPPRVDLSDRRRTADRRDVTAEQEPRCAVPALAKGVAAEPEEKTSQRPQAGEGYGALPR
jgi:hypothetical protein